MKETSTHQNTTMATTVKANNAGRHPRRQTIEMIRQFARAYYAPQANIAIVLN